MNGYNRVIITGNLVRDPELRYTPQGTAICDMSIAINSGKKDKDETVFVDVAVWEKQAEACNQYLVKGRPVLIEGRLRQEKWTDKESGQKRSRLSIVADRVQFLGGNGEGAEAPQQEKKPAAPAAPDSPPQQGSLVSSNDNTPF